MGAPPGQGGLGRICRKFIGLQGLPQALRETLAFERSQNARVSKKHRQEFY